MEIREFLIISELTFNPAISSDNHWLLTKVSPILYLIYHFSDNFYNDEAGSDQWKRSDDSQRVDFGEMMKRALEDDDFMLR